MFELLNEAVSQLTSVLHEIIRLIQLDTANSNSVFFNPPLFGTQSLRFTTYFSFSLRVRSSGVQLHSEVVVLCCFDRQMNATCEYQSGQSDLHLTECDGTLVCQSKDHDEQWVDIVSN